MAYGEAEGEVPALSPPSVVDTPAVTVGGSVVATAPVGATLAATVGNWNGTPSDYWQSWLSDSNLVGNGRSYVAQAGDVGHSITCTVTATNAAGSTTAPPSNAVAITATTTRKGE